MKPLRIVLLCTEDHLGSTIVLNRLRFCPDIEVVGIVYGMTIGKSAHKVDRLWRYFLSFGWLFSWLLIWQRAAETIGYKLACLLSYFRGGKYLAPINAIAENRNIPVSTAPVNSAEAAEFIKGLKADLIVSAYFNQILKPDVMELVPYGAINIHPGMLPHYKGAMTYFWALRYNERSAGVCLHKIDEGIDTGEIIAYKTFRVTGRTTQQQALARSAVIGARLLHQFCKQLAQGQMIEALPQENLSGKYHSLPQERDFNAYFSRRRFFRIRDIWALMMRNWRKNKKRSVST